MVSAMAERTDAEHYANAFAEGYKAAETHATLANHERRLNAINGSIERHAKQAAALARSVDELRDEFAAGRALDEKRHAVSEALADYVQSTKSKQVSARGFRLGLIVAVVVGVLGSVSTIIAALIAAHVI